MKWFEGPIPEAIQLAKEKGTVFVVYIYGKPKKFQYKPVGWL